MTVKPPADDWGKPGKGRSGLAGAITGFIFKEAALVVVCFLVVPLFNVEIPWPVVAVIAVVIAVQSWFGYRWGKRSVEQKASSGVSTLEGKTARVVEWVDEDVIMVRVEGELWKAIYKPPRPLVGDEVKVIKVLDGLKLIVVGRVEPPARPSATAT
jgi:membrane protein implicated in regulation of membrane protease activity